MESQSVNMWWSKSKNHFANIFILCIYYLFVNYNTLREDNFIVLNMYPNSNCSRGVIRVSCEALLSPAKRRLSTRKWEVLHKFCYYTCHVIVIKSPNFLFFQIGSNCCSHSFHSAPTFVSSRESFKWKCQF